MKIKRYTARDMRQAMQKVREDRSANGSAAEDSRFYDPYPVASRDPMKLAGERCSVAFWNLSVIFQVDAPTRVLVT